MLTVRIKALRKGRNKTQQDIATLLGVSRPAYTAYEQGNRTPDNETIEKLADYYDVTIDYLYGRTDNPSRISDKDERDIAKRMTKMKKDLIEGNADGEGLNFMGEPMSEEAIESLLEALEHAERIATLANKKFTPNKYRDK